VACAALKRIVGRQRVRRLRRAGCPSHQAGRRSRGAPGTTSNEATLPQQTPDMDHRAEHAGVNAHDGVKQPVIDASAGRTGVCHAHQRCPGLDPLSRPLLDDQSGATVFPPALPPSLEGIVHHCPLPATLRSGKSSTPHLVRNGYPDVRAAAQRHHSVKDAMISGWGCCLNVKVAPGLRTFSTMNAAI
jgi:hypothetical protein